MFPLLRDDAQTEQFEHLCSLLITRDITLKMTLKRQSSSSMPSGTLTTEMTCTVNCVVLPAAHEH